MIHALGYVLLGLCGASLVALAGFIAFGEWRAYRQRRTRAQVLAAELRRDIARTKARILAERRN